MLAKLADVASEHDDGIAYLWPECVPAWVAFQGAQTMWQCGVSGATGLDWAGLNAELLDDFPDLDERRDVRAGIKACERAVLDVWAARRAREDAANEAARR